MISKNKALRKKLDWCIALDRNGGFWRIVDWHMIDIRQFDGSVWQVPGMVSRLRWRWA